MWKSIARFAKPLLIKALGNRGVVLLELLTALPLAMLVLLASLSVFSLMQAGFERLFQDAEQQFYARVLLEQINRDVKQSHSSEVKNGGTVLCLRGREGGEVRYYFNRRQVLRSSGGSSIPVTENTKSIYFCDLNEDTIQVDLELEQDQNSFFISSICTRRH